MNNLIKRVWTRKELVFVEDLRGMAFTNEDGAHTFSIAGKDENGADLALSGTVAGSLIRPDGTTTAMTGTIADGCANLTLSPECYGVSGRASLTIFLTSGGQKTAIYHAVMSIGKSSTSQVSPGVAADVVDLVNRIDTATASIPATYTALLGSIASDYSSSKTYKAGNYVWYGGYLYKAKQDIDTAESWASEHWTKAVLADDFRSEITNLKSALDENISARLSDVDGIQVPQTMELGTMAFASTAIAWQASTTRIRIPSTVAIDVSKNDIIKLTDYNNCKFTASVQTDVDSYTYVGFRQTDYVVPNGGRLYLVVAYSDDRTITNVSDLANRVRIVGSDGAISSLDSRVKALESYNYVINTHSLPADLFGAGTYESGTYNPSFRTYRLSTIRTLVYGYDLTVKADDGWRFYCSKYINGAWVVEPWATELHIDAGTPFGFTLAKTSEDATSTATVAEFLPHYTFSTDLSETIEALDERVTELEGDVIVDTSKIAEYMSHFYASNVAEAYAFFTDPHLMGSAGAFDEKNFKKYINVLSETVKRTSAAYVVCGGDWLNREDTKSQASAKLGYVDGQMRALFPEKYYPIAGNHDFNYIGYEDGSRLPESGWVSNTAMRNFWFHEYEQCYYKFKVMTAQNYVLNTRTDYDGTNAYDKTMLDWFSAQLIEDDAPHCTVMFHIMHLSSVSSAIPKRVVAIGKIIEAFNNHTICTLSIDTEGYDKTYDFTGTTGKIDYVIVGHTHADFTEIFGGVPVIGCVNFTKDDTSSFDLVFADYTNHKVYTTRIGSGESREFNI